MSTERLSFGFNSLIPETYKTKAEAFAKCLHHKLLSLGRIDSSSESEPYGGASRRLSCENQESQVYYGGNSKQALENNAKKQSNEERTACSFVENNRKIEKTDDSDEEFRSHSESENGDWMYKKDISGTKQKLVSMSSEDSTLDSWSSCQENLTDFEKFDSETEEVNSLAAQVKGSPKLRSFNMRTKRKELREKTWKRNSKKNHSSSTESIDSEGVKQSQNRQAENLDPEFSSQYILLDGLEPEDDEVPHRILRGSSSTSNLERHFSSRGVTAGDLQKNTFKMEKKIKEAPSVSGNANLLTPPPSPVLERKTDLGDSRSKEEENLGNRLNFARFETDFEGGDFHEVECLKDFYVADLSMSVKKIGGVIVECPTEGIKTNFEVPLNYSEDCTITCVEVLQDNSNEEKILSEGTAFEVREAPPTKEVKTEDIDAVEDDEMRNSRTQMRRCSSLKTWKTPPGTPGGKKIVRFADALGLDLADVRTFLDEIPKIPSSAYEDLHFDLSKLEQLPPCPPTPTLVPLYQQPGDKMDFLEKLQNQKICLESTMVTNEGVLAVTGFIRVQNMSFQKTVHVRYTLNNWQTFSDLQATYVPSSSDGFSDRFSFILYGHTLKIRQKLEFALRLECCGAQYWDNNGGLNYILNCLPQSSATSFFSSLCSNQADPWFDFY